MKIFVSYSVADTELVRFITGELKSTFEKVMWWEESKEPGADSWKIIEGWISSSDLIVVILTGETLKRSMAVGNEVGISKAKGKTIIPLVAPEVPTSELGCLSGITYIRIDKADPVGAIEAVKKQAQIIEQRNKANAGVALTLMGLIALLLAKK
jgi:hypothetical protein